MASASEPQISSLGGGLSQDILDRLLGHREGDTPPPLMKNTATGEHTFMGLPFKGDPNLMLKKDDPRWRQPQLRYEVHVQIFNLDTPDDVAAYTEVCQKVANSKAMISYEKIEYAEVRRTWQVLLRWMDIYMQGPEQEPARAGPAKEN